MATLPSNHIIKSLLERKHNKKLKGFIVNINNYLNGIFSSFDSLNDIFHPRYRLIDIFPSCLSINIIMISLSCSQYDCNMSYRYWGCFFMT